MAGDGLAITARRARDHVERALTMLAQCDLHPAVKQAMAQLGDLIFEPIRSLQPEVLRTR